MPGNKKKKQFRTYKYRLLPSKKQHQALADICESQRQIYNAALQERIGCYEKTGKSRSFVDQCRGLTELRTDPEFSAIPVNVQRWTIKRVDDAYNAFYRRQKSASKAGFPRFRGKGWWKAFGFRQTIGLQFDGNRLRFKGLPGGLRVHMHRPLPKDAEIKSVVFRRDVKGWHVCLQCAIPAAEAEHEGPAVGIHIDLATCATLSTGETIPAPQVARRAERELRRRMRAVKRSHRAMKQRGGQITNTYLKRKQAYARQQARVANTRRTFLHQQSARLAREYGLIAVENLNANSVIQKFPHMAKPIYEAAWYQFINFLTYKAERAGGEVIRVDSGNKNENCPRCGQIILEGDTSASAHDIVSCDPSVDWAKYAASKILTLAVTSQGQANVTD